MKKGVLLFVLASSLLLTSCSTNNSNNALNKEESNLLNTEEILEIKFAKKKNNIVGKDTPTGTNSTLIYSEANVPFLFGFEKVSYCGVYVWQRVSRNGCFYTSYNSTLENENRMYDMKTLTFEFDVNNLEYTIFFSRDGVFDGNGEWSKSYKTTKGQQVIEVEGPANYFLFRASSKFAFIDILSLTISYTGNKNTFDAWDKTHGVIPTLSDDKKTIKFGLFPQTHVKDPEEGLINAANGKADEEYFWYNGEFYVKDTGDPYWEDQWYGNNHFSTGVYIFKNETYIFKCEPIVWNINLSIDGMYKINTQQCLYSRQFHGYSCEYPKSDVRSWLTPVDGVSNSGVFYYRAFSFVNNVEDIINKTFILESNVNDFVYIGSKDEYQEWYPENYLRAKKASDFGICNYSKINIWWSPYNSDYWTRTPYPDYKYLMNYVYDDGSFDEEECYDHLGISPSITIKI